MQISYEIVHLVYHNIPSMSILSSREHFYNSKTVIMTEVVNTVRNDRSALLDNSAGTVVKYAYDALATARC